MTDSVDCKARHIVCGSWFPLMRLTFQLPANEFYKSGFVVTNINLTFLFIFLPLLIVNYVQERLHQILVLIKF